MQSRNEKRRPSKLATALTSFDIELIQDAIEDGESFASLPLINHPFLALTPEQQIYYYKQHVTFTPESDSGDQVMDFYLWLNQEVPGTQTKVFSLTHLNITQEHINAYIGLDFDVQSLVQDAAGFIPLFGYIANGQLRHADEESIRKSAKLSEVLLKNHPDNIIYYELLTLFEYAEDIEQVASLFTKPLIASDDFADPIPFWLFALYQGEELFVKAMVTKLGIKLDGNAENTRFERRASSGTKVVGPIFLSLSNECYSDEELMNSFMPFDLNKIVRIVTPYDTRSNSALSVFLGYNITNTAISHVISRCKEVISSQEIKIINHFDRLGLLTDLRSFGKIDLKEIFTKKEVSRTLAQSLTLANLGHLIKKIELHNESIDQKMNQENGVNDYRNKLLAFIQTLKAGSIDNPDLKKCAIISDKASPLWVELLKEGEIDLFLKLAVRQEIAAHSLDANAVRIFNLEEANVSLSLFTQFHSDAFKADVLYYLTPFNLNLGQIAFGQLKSNFAYCVGKFDVNVLRVMVANRNEKPIDFDAFYQRRVLLYALIETNKVAFACEICKYSLGEIDLNVEIKQESTKDKTVTVTTLEKYLAPYRNKPTLLGKLTKEIDKVNCPVPVRSVRKPSKGIHDARELPVKNVPEPRQLESQVRKLVCSVAEKLSLDIEINASNDLWLVCFKGKNVGYLRKKIEANPALKLTCSESSILIAATLHAFNTAFRNVNRFELTQESRCVVQEVKVNFSDKDIEKFIEQVDYAFCKARGVTVKWLAKEERFIIHYSAEAWSILPPDAPHSVKMNISFEKGELDSIILRIVRYLSGFASVTCSDNSIHIKLHKNEIPSLTNLRAIIYKELSKCKTITTTNEKIVQPVLAPPTLRVNEVAGLEPVVESTSINSAELLLNHLKKIIAELAAVPIENLKFLKTIECKQKKFIISFARREPIAGILVPDFFAEVSNAMNAQRQSAVDFFPQERKDNYKWVIRVSVEILATFDMQKLQSDFNKNTANKRSQLILFQPQEAACANLRLGFNTSDHTFQSLKVNVINRQQQAICTLNVRTFNLLNYCVSKSDNIFKNYSNNPFNLTEKPKEYLARKRKQIEKILGFLSPDQDCLFLQEIDIFTNAPALIKGEDLNEYIEIRKLFFSRVGKDKLWDYKMIPVMPGSRPMMTVYNQSKLHCIDHQIIKNIFECKFKLVACADDQYVTLSNISLEYGKEDELKHYLTSKQDEFIIVGGDNNAETEFNFWISNANQATNLIADGDSGSFIDTLKDGRKRCIDGFAVKAKSDYKVVVEEMPGEAFEFSAFRGQFMVVVTNPSKDNPDCFIHTGDFGAICQRSVKEKSGCALKCNVNGSA